MRCPICGVDDAKLYIENGYLTPGNHYNIPVMCDCISDNECMEIVGYVNIYVTVRRKRK